jgi:hypothetical protein
VSEVRRILNWIGRNTAGTAPVRNGKMFAGDLTLQMAFRQRTGFYDPFDIRIGRQTHIPIKSSLRFTFQTPRRIRFTPFITAYGYDQHIFVWTVDFTDISKPTACYRIVLFQFLDRAFLPSFTIEKTGCRVKDRTYELSPGFFIQTGATWQTGEEKGCLLLKPAPDANGEAYATLQFGDQTAFVTEDEPLRFFGKLTKESEKSRSVYPLKYFFTGESNPLSLEGIWFSQDLLTPDGEVEESAFKSGKGSDRWLPWLWILSMYIPHTGLAGQLRAFAETCRQTEKIHSPRVAFLIDRMCNKDPVSTVKKDRSDPFRIVFRSGESDVASGDWDYFYNAMFGELSDTGETVNRLQEWWNRYTMSVYDLRWKSELEGNTELFFIIYLLALRHKMPWAGLMLNRCGDFTGKPLFALLAKISVRVMLHQYRDGSMRITPGPVRSTNVVRTPAKEISTRVSYTKFGLATYFSVQRNERGLLKLDKEAACIVDNSWQHFSILPNIYPPRSEFNGVSRINAESGTDSVKLPLVWRKGMLRFGDARIRWILKKDRFQITIQALADLDGYRINEQTISLKCGQRKILYAYPEKVNRSANLSILTEKGRTIHERKHKSGRPVHLAGWASDRYGVFVPVVNYRHHIRQHPIRADDAGQISANLCIPSETGQISLMVKGYVRDFELHFMRNRALAKFLRSDPVSSGSLRIHIDRKVEGNPDELLRYFENEFGLQCELIMSDHPYPDKFPGGIIICPAGESDLKRNAPDESVLVIPAPPDRSLDRMIRDELSYLQG